MRRDKNRTRIPRIQHTKHKIKESRVREREKLRERGCNFVTFYILRASERRATNYGFIPLSAEIRSIGNPVHRDDVLHFNLKREFQAFGRIRRQKKLQVELLNRVRQMLPGICWNYHEIRGASRCHAAINATIKIPSEPTDAVVQGKSYASVQINYVFIFLFITKAELA